MHRACTQHPLPPHGPALPGKLVGTGHAGQGDVGGTNVHKVGLTSPAQKAAEPGTDPKPRSAPPAPPVLCSLHTARFGFRFFAFFRDDEGANSHCHMGMRLINTRHTFTGKY